MAEECLTTELTPLPLLGVAVSAVELTTEDVAAPELDTTVEEC